MLIDPLTQKIIGAACEVHSVLGPGLLESVYEECLCYELDLLGVTFQRQLVVPVRYKSLELPAVYRLDLLVENRVIVEVKSVETLLPIHAAQLYTYLAVADLDLALLINFNEVHLRHGIRRLRHRSPKNLRVSSSPRILP